MRISVSCPACESSFRTDDANAGKATRCKSCGERFVIEVPFVSGTSAPDEVAAVESAPAPAMAVVGGLVVGLVGAGAWAALALVGSLEVGYLAWGIGAGIGFVMVKLGARGTGLGVAAAALAILSIFGGKYVAMHMALERAIDDVLTTENYQVAVTDASDFVALGDDPSDEVLVHYMYDHEFTDAESEFEITEDDVELFRALSADSLREFDAAGTTFAVWRDDAEANMRSSLAAAGLGPIDSLREELSPIDIVFALLGIATAFRIVARQTAC